MKFLGLTPEAVLKRMPAEPTALQVPSWPRSLLAGALGFAAVSLLVFGTWAAAGKWFYGHLGEAGAYLAWALIFIAGAGDVFSRLVIGPGSGARFRGGFALAFLAYSVAWMAAWFALRGQTGEWLGAVAGTTVFGLLLCAMFDGWAGCLSAVFGLIAGNVAGYFLGSVLHTHWGGTTGKMLWGLAYGLGFGAGIGHALYVVQSGIRQRLVESAAPLPG